MHREGAHVEPLEPGYPCRRPLLALAVLLKRPSLFPYHWSRGSTVNTENMCATIFDEGLCTVAFVFALSHIEVICLVWAANACTIAQFVF